MSQRKSSPLDGSDTSEYKKYLYLSAIVCLIAAAYALLRPLKMTLFYRLVGKQYYPICRIFMVFFAIPSVALYSRLVDSFKRKTILYTTFTLYSLFCFIFSLFLLNPSLGLANTTPSVYRVLGWVYTICIDFYPTFVVGALWAFINSVSTPNFAKNNYSYFYIFIKIGSLISGSLGLFLTGYFANNTSISSYLILVGAALTLISLWFVRRLIQTVPEEHLEGYQGTALREVPPLAKKPKKRTVLGMLEGFRFIITTPYVFGIFLLFYFYDLIFIVIEYQASLLIDAQGHANANYLSSMLFLSGIVSQLIGLAITYFITTRLLRKIPLTYMLMLMPLITACIILMTTFFPSLYTMLAAMALLPAFHYSIDSPGREMLFIPTIRDIQFKSKAWIDSFGRTLSKSSGSSINILFYQIPPALFIPINATFSFIIIGLWSVVAFLMGRYYHRTINKKELIDG